MYSDSTLTPREAIRLCALGILAGRPKTASSPMTYDELAQAVRHFISRITGPSLDLMGESIELLRFEGLAETEDNSDNSNPILFITQSGLDALEMLLLANIRPGGSDFNELVFALKFHFFHHLSKIQQVNQIDLIMEICETELARFEDLIDHHNSDPGHITGWLEHNITRVKSRLEWLKLFKLNLDQ